MQMWGMKLTLFLIVMILVTSGIPAWAQGSSNTGTVQGAITDQQGAVVVGATVTLTDNGTKASRSAITNASGRYIFVDVPPGSYGLAISKQGFATSKTDNLQVTVGVALTLDLSLQVGGASVVVEVQTTGSELQTLNATVGNTLNAIALDNLPSIGRDVNTFIELQPGVGTDGSVAGAVNDQSYFSLDGGNNSNDMDGSGGVYTNVQQNLVIGDPTGGMAAENTFSAPSGVMPTPADSVEEFKVNSAGQTADFNSSAGAEIKVVTKRGTNAFHGTAYEYYKDNNWSSNAWLSNWQNSSGGHVGLPSYHYSRYGGAIGGPLIPKEVLGGKTYFFFNYEGFSYPFSQVISRNVPSPALMQGLLLDDGPSSSAPNAPPAGTVDYNLSNSQVSYKGQTYAPGYGCNNASHGTSGTPCDPAGFGLNPVVQKIWSQYEPASNAPCSGGNFFCDSQNVLGFSGAENTPISSKFWVGRIDHDFGSKQHLMVSYRYYNMKLVGTEQNDIGGFFPGDTKGVPASVSQDPVQDWYLVAGLTTNITPNTTNDFHFSHLRNWWQWGRAGAVPQLPGMGGAVALQTGENPTEDLGPYNVNNQQTRRRFWDGSDNMFRDDLSMLHGNHLFQFGGMYQHNFDYHQRNDNGGFANAFPVYSLGFGNGGSKLNDASFPAIDACKNNGTNGVSTQVNIAFCPSLAATELGVVSVASQVFTRTGSNLALNTAPPALASAFDKSTIPYYNVYFSDTWHLKPTMTLTYGLGYALEMPPTEANGKQTVLVDDTGAPVQTLSYLDSVRRAALAGQAFSPELGFALVGNTGGGTKYPYNPFYGEFSPRVAFAWSPKATSGILGNTVVRVGYGRQYGRTNGVDQVLVPLLGLGLTQAESCASNISGTTGRWGCGAASQATWGGGTASNAANAGARICAPGIGFGCPAGSPYISTVPLSNLATATLPQPVYPGYNNPASSSPEGLDPNFRASAIDSFDLSIQRQVNRKVTLELGYIGRRISNEFQPMMLNAVPYMMTQGGQQFKQAYANTLLQYCGGFAGMGGGNCAGNYSAVTPQPFFETALGGAKSAYCSTPVMVNGASVTPTNCTQAVALNEGVSGTSNLSTQNVWSLWSDLDNGAFKTFGRTMENTPIASTCTGTNTNGCSGAYTSTVAQNASVGYSNYNGAFVSVKMADWRGLTMQSNLTWSKALGTGTQGQASSLLTALDPFNLNLEYGVQPFDRRITYNSYFVYQPPFYKGQQGLMGRVLGGWTFASIFTTGTGVPIEVATVNGNFQTFGACDGVACAEYDVENAVPINRQSLHTKAHYCAGTPACGGGVPVNYFANGINAAANFRDPILGVDTKDGGYGILTGLSYWNMDFSIKKDIRVTEGVSLEFQGVFANILNHNQWLDSYPVLGIPSIFGSVGNEALGNTAFSNNSEAEPRNIELGARVRF